MPSFEALNEFVQRTQARETARQQADRARIIAHGASAEAIQGLDGYEDWVNQLDTWQSECAARADQWRRTAASHWPGPGQTMAEFLLQARIRAEVAEAESNAYKRAKDLIPELVKRGQSAA